MPDRTHFPYGAVLKIQREYDSDEIRRQMKALKDLGLNTAVVWPAVYWWEGRSPSYPYATGGRILEYAGEIGLRVIMELAGQLASLEYAPDCVMKDEYYMVTRDGHYDKGGWYYCGLNYNHPGVKRLVKRQFRAIAGRYRGYSSLYGYDIWNETAFTSFDRHTLRLFRLWLRRKYGTIERLNASWDRAYRRWSQIEFTRLIWASVMPVVDYEQFHKENVGQILAEWREVIRAVDPGHPVIADNIGSILTNEERGYDRPQDDWNVALNVDEFGISFYPKSAAGTDEPFIRWETLAAGRCAAGTRRFWVSELQSHNRAMFDPFTAVHPGELRQWNWEAVAQGAKGIIHWQWRPFQRGIQTAGRGLLDFRDEYSPRAEEAAAITRIIGENEREFLAYRPEKPGAAILYDQLNHDFIKALTTRFNPEVPNTLYSDSIGGLYRALWDLNIPADFVTGAEVAAGGLTGYRVLFLTNQVCLSAELARGLRRYVEGGGILVCDAKFGWVDEAGTLFRDLPGGPLNDLTGCRLVDVDPSGLFISADLEGIGRIEMRGCYERCILRVGDPGVEVRGRFADGSPAVVRAKHGAGGLVLIATFLWYGYGRETDPGARAFLESLAGELNLRTAAALDERLKIRILRGEDGLILLAFNYTGETVTTTVTIGDVGRGNYRFRDLYAGQTGCVPAVDGVLSLDLSVGPDDVAVVKIAEDGGPGQTANIDGKKGEP